MIQPQYFPKIENNKFRFKNKNKIEAIIRYLGPETYNKLNGRESAQDIQQILQDRLKKDRLDQPMNSTGEFKTIITKEHDLDSPVARIQNESHLSSMSINMTGSPILDDQHEQTPLFIH